MFQGKNIGCYFQGKWSLRNELENSILINSLNKHVENLSFNKFSHFLHNFTETICWREYLQKVNCHIITLCQLYLGVSNRNVVSYQLRKMQKSKFTFICYNAFKLRKSFCRGIFSNWTWKSNIIFLHVCYFLVHSLAITAWLQYEIAQCNILWRYPKDTTTNFSSSF